MNEVLDMITLLKYEAMKNRTAIGMKSKNINDVPC